MPKKRVRTPARNERQDHASNKQRVRRGALTLAAAATATTMTLAPIAPTPQAQADIIDDICGIGVVRCDFVTAGLLTKPIFDLTALIYSIPFLSDLLPPGVIDIPLLGPTDVNALIPGLLGKFSSQFFLPDINGIVSGLLGMQASPLGTHTVVGIMDGALTTGQAITGAQNSITPVFGVNNYNYVLVRNPGRANGGMASRFDWLYNLTGIPGSAVSGNVATKQDTSILPCAGGILCQYIPVKIDLGLGYDSMSDFPIAPIASVSIINSIMQSFLPTNYLGTIQIVAQDAGNQNFYLTVVPTDSALLEPLRLAKRLQNQIGIEIPIISTIFADLPNALANALEPAVDILINIGYADVSLTTYQRSFTDFNTNKQFFIDSTLTIDQYFAAVGAAIGAAIGGLGSIFSGNLSVATTPAPAPAGPSSNAAAGQPLVAAVQQAVAALPSAAAQPSVAAEHQGAAAQSEAVVVESALTGADEAVGTTVVANDSAATTAEGPSENDAALDGTLTAPDDQVDTAKEKLDAAADQARARATDALGGAQDRDSTSTDQLADAVDPTSTTAPDDTPGAGDTNQTDQGEGTNSAATSSDSAA